MEFVVSHIGRGNGFKTIIKNIPNEYQANIKNVLRDCFGAQTAVTFEETGQMIVTMAGVITRDRIIDCLKGETMMEEEME